MKPSLTVPSFTLESKATIMSGILLLIVIGAKAPVDRRAFG